MLPSIWLGRKTARRQKQIRNGLPDALDLMIVCIEAGSGIDQSLIKTSDELDISYPALAEELRLITTEMRAGKPRLEAFKNFASRTKVDEVRSLVAMLVQTDRFGTSIAQALRTHAEVSRTKRRQNAEERAAKIGVKLVFPLVFCLFPVALRSHSRTGGGGLRSGLQAGTFQISVTVQQEKKMNTQLVVSRCRWRAVLVLYMLRRRSRLSREDVATRRPHEVSFQSSFDVRTCDGARREMRVGTGASKTDGVRCFAASRDCCSPLRRSAWYRAARRGSRASPPVRQAGEPATSFDVQPVKPKADEARATMPASCGRCRPTHERTSRLAPTLESRDPVSASALAQAADAPDGRKPSRGRRGVPASRRHGLRVPSTARRRCSSTRATAGAFEGLARLWRDWGSPELALGDAHRAIHCRPDSASAYNTLGTVLRGARAAAAGQARVRACAAAR